MTDSDGAKTGMDKMEGKGIRGETKFAAQAKWGIDKMKCMEFRSGTKFMVILISTCPEYTYLQTCSCDTKLMTVSVLLTRTGTENPNRHEWTCISNAEDK